MPQEAQTSGDVIKRAMLPREMDSCGSEWPKNTEMDFMSEAAFKTMRHIETVRNFLTVCIHELLERQVHHDQSKLEAPEKEAYDIITASLRGSEYGSETYKHTMREQQHAIDHHYAHNAHHPEWGKFHLEGAKLTEWERNQLCAMNLIDLLEMICDWKAATLRHDTGDIYKSLEINQKRFGYSDELKQIFLNTVEWLHTKPVYHKADES